MNSSAAFSPQIRIADLLRPAAYPEPPSEVQLIETHISWVFLAGSHVYKVKKALDLGFLDFRERARRRFFCEEELRLNAFLAPGIYRGIVNIGSAADGRLAFGEQGPPEEPAVHMQRLPQEGMLDQLARRGFVEASAIDALAARLVEFHGQAARSTRIAAYGRADAVRELCEQNFDALAPWTCAAGDRVALLSSATLAQLRRATEAFLHSRRTLFDHRVRARFIVEGHGDLHAGNICFVEGQPIAFDALEFSERFRCCDVACDLAFLTMDLRRCGQPHLAERIAQRYAHLAADSDLLQLLPFYEAYRALVRAKIAALRVGAHAREDGHATECRAEVALALAALDAC